MSPPWRIDDEEKPLGLKITKAGLAAIGVADDTAGQEEPAPKPKSGRAKKRASEISKAGAPRAGSKQGQIIALMTRKTGATLEDMVEATGWLPHTTRAALTGLRRKGYGLAKDKKKAGKTVYRIENAAGASSAAEAA